MIIVRKRCSEPTCNEEKDTCDCNGCLTTFCHQYYTKHRENLDKKLNQIQHDYNSFREIFNDRKNNDPILELDQWEMESINKIKEMVQQCRENVIKRRKKFIIESEKHLIMLAT